jgi:hypothetical protein
MPIFFYNIPVIGGVSYMIKGKLTYSNNDVICDYTIIACAEDPWYAFEDDDDDDPASSVTRDDDDNTSPIEFNKAGFKKSPDLLDEDEPDVYLEIYDHQNFLKKIDIQLQIQNLVE